MMTYIAIALLGIIAILLLIIAINVTRFYPILEFIDAEHDLTLDHLDKIEFAIRILLKRKYNINLNEAYSLYKQKTEMSLEEELLNEEDLEETDSSEAELE